MTGARLSDEPVMTLEVEVSAPVDIGDGPSGHRRFVPITGGRFSGMIAGEVLPGGADWQTVTRSGALEIEARYVLKTDAGALVEVQSIGVRSGSPEVLAALGRGEAVPPDQYYFRTMIRLTAADAALAELNDQLFIAAGDRRAGTVVLTMYAVI